MEESDPPRCPGVQVSRCPGVQMQSVRSDLAVTFDHSFRMEFFYDTRCRHSQDVCGD